MLFVVKRTTRPSVILCSEFGRQMYGNLMSLICSICDQSNLHKTNEKEGIERKTEYTREGLCLWAPFILSFPLNERNCSNYTVSVYVSKGWHRNNERRTDINIANDDWRRRCREPENQTEQHCRGSCAHCVPDVSRLQPVDIDVQV